MMMVKRLIAIMMTVLILASTSVCVNANTIGMLDYGFGYKNSNGYESSVNGAGSTITGNYFNWFWALDSFSPDYTYTFEFRFTSTERIPTSSKTLVYVTKEKIRTFSSDLNSVGAYSILERTDNNYTARVKINFGLLGIKAFPVYVTMRLSNAITITTTINGWGVSAEYDPGGSSYIEEYLNQIVNAGDGYPVPDGTNLDNSVNDLSSAEGSIKDKASSLKDSISSDLTTNISSAKTLVSTLKPASMQINNLYTTVMTALPAEVKAVFIAIPLLLFIGWLIGRIRE